MTQRLLIAAGSTFVLARNALTGSSTAVIASMVNNDGLMKVANLGDSGLMVVRDQKCHFLMEEKQWQFNTPYQLTAPPPKCVRKVLVVHLEAGPALYVDRVHVAVCLSVCPMATHCFTCPGTAGAAGKWWLSF